VVVLGDAALPAVQALVRWAPGGHADRELAERRALGFPPAAVFVELTGPPAVVDDFLNAAILPASSEVLGPVATTARAGETEAVRALIRAPRAEAAQLAAELHAAQGARSARKLPTVRVRVDPVDIG